MTHPIAYNKSAITPTTLKIQECLILWQFRMTTTTNHIIFSLGVIHCLRVFVILAYLFALKLQGWFDICLRHLIHTRRQVEKTCGLTCDHETWVIVPIDYPPCIPISLSVVNIEAF